MKGNGTFDQLNEALFAQLERLANAGDEDIENEIKRSNAVSQLASNINNNMANAVKVAGILSMEGMDVSGMKATLPGMLNQPMLSAPNWEVVDPFIADNAESHTASYIADRLRAQGVDVTAQAVRQRCREIGVECKDISKGVDLKDVEHERYAERAGGKS